MADFTLQALNDEIDTDPEGLGYKEVGGEWKGDAEIADLINDELLGDTIQRHMVAPKELIEQITILDWNAISSANRLYLQLLPSLGSISTVVNGTEVRDNLLSIFTAGMDTRDNLIGVVQRPGSRAEVLWGEGVTISIGQVGHAANL